MLFKKAHEKTPLPGKEYFIKNPEGFLFTHLFASGTVLERFSELAGGEASITAQAIHCAPTTYVKAFKNHTAIIIEFPPEFPGAAIMIIPTHPLTALTKHTGTAPVEFLSRLFEPVSNNLSLLTQKSYPPVVIHKALPDAVQYSDSDTLCLWIKYLFSAGGIADVVFVQCIMPELFQSVHKEFGGGDSPLRAVNSDEFIEIVRQVNKKFQERLFETITTSETGKIDLKSGAVPGEAVSEISLEELLLADDRTIRVILDETSRRRMPVKTFVFALQGMSDTLRERFLHNMSHNRRAEVREELSLWKSTREEQLQAQRELAFIILDVADSGGITLNPLIRRHFEQVIASLDAALIKSAQNYLQSGHFDNAVVSLNDVLLQLLLRRVQRQVFVAALSEAHKQVHFKIRANMTPFSHQLLLEDIEHHRKAVSTESERFGQAASAQQEIIRTAEKLKKELMQMAF